MHEQAHEGGVPLADDQWGRTGARSGGHRAAECESPGCPRLPWCVLCFGDPVVWQNMQVAHDILTSGKIILLANRPAAMVASVLLVDHIYWRARWLSLRGFYEFSTRH